MARQQTPKKALTPPKGRPTRGRNEQVRPKRVFGPTAQWIAAVFLLALIFLTLIVLLDGGDFNVFNDVPTG